MIDEGGTAATSAVAVVAEILAWLCATPRLRRAPARVAGGWS